MLVKGYFGKHDRWEPTLDFNRERRKHAGVVSLKLSLTDLARVSSAKNKVLIRNSTDASWALRRKISLDLGNSP